MCMYGSYGENKLLLDGEKIIVKPIRGQTRSHSPHVLSYGNDFVPYRHGLLPRHSVKTWPTVGFTPHQWNSC